jgi:hypothetical protein
MRAIKAVARANCEHEPYQDLVSHVTGQMEFRYGTCPVTALIESGQVIRARPAS